MLSRKDREVAQGDLSFLEKCLKQEQVGVGCRGGAGSVGLFLFLRKKYLLVAVFLPSVSVNHLCSPQRNKNLIIETQLTSFHLITLQHNIHLYPSRLQTVHFKCDNLLYKCSRFISCFCKESQKY